MKSFSGLLLLLLFLSVASAEKQRFDIRSVGLSVQLTETWESQGEPTGPDGTYPGDSEFQAGFAYIVDQDISDPRNYKFNEFQVQRHDYFDASKRKGWMRGKVGLGTSDQIIIELNPIVLNVKMPFDEVVVFRYREDRGDEWQKKSAGYVVFALKGDSAFRISVAGLERQFNTDDSLYKNILGSIAITQ